MHSNPPGRRRAGHAGVKFLLRSLKSVNKDTNYTKLQALVYDSLPPTSAIVDYAIGLQKLSANGHFVVVVCFGLVSLLLKWHCICNQNETDNSYYISLYQAYCFITTHLAYASTLLWSAIPDNNDYPSAMANHVRQQR